MDPLAEKIETHGLAGGTGCSIDRISDLPDDIIHNILSLSGFEMFEVVELSVLSKRWNQLYATMPYFDFDISWFYMSRMEGVYIDIGILEKFRSFINWVLISQGECNVIRFRLHSYSLFDSVQVLRWLHPIVKRNVQELDVRIVPSGGFKLPLCIATCETLKVLKLNLMDSVEQSVMLLPSYVRLNSLKLLDLEGIEFTNSESLQRLFSGCCALEGLRLTNCSAENFTFLDFSSVHLKQLVLCFDIDIPLENCEIKISCPVLHVFKYSGSALKTLLLEDVSSLQSVWIDFTFGSESWEFRQLVQKVLKKVHNVKVLNLDLAYVPALSRSMDVLVKTPTTFHKLKCLSVTFPLFGDFTQVLFLLLNYCPNLEVLTVVVDERISEPTETEQWQLDDHEGIVSWKSHPHLKTFQLDSFVGYDYELDFLRFILQNARSLEKLNIIWNERYLENKWLEAIELEELVLTFSIPYSDLKVAILDCRSDEFSAW